MSCHRSRTGPTALQRMLAAIVVAVVASWVIAAVASATGATLYASPSGVASGSCTAGVPCTLSFAISQAAAGDTVDVTAGTYSIAAGISIAKAITVQGTPGQPRPALIGTSALTSDVITASAGATLNDLDIETTTISTTAQNAALVVDGATAENLTVSAGSGDSQGEAISIKDSAAGTVVRTVLAVSAAPGGEAASFKDSTSGAGTASALNLTAVSTSSQTDAISGNVVSGTINIQNAIATGPGTDISIKPGTMALNVSYSDFSSSSLGAVASGAGNISAAPLFINSNASDYHEAAGSPTVSSGTTSAGMTSTDLDGHSWPASNPDMGAYQYVGSISTGSGSGTAGSGSTGTPPSGSTGTPPSGSTGTPPSGSTGSTGATGARLSGSTGAPSGSTGAPLSAPSQPGADVSVTARPRSGTIEVELPGTHAYVPLAAAAELPVGTVIDANHGSVTLVSAIDRHGATRAGTFQGGAFTVTQTRGAHPLTDLRLVGGSFADCASTTTGRTAARRTGAAVFQAMLPRASRPRPSHRVVRQLWGRDHGGHFVTIGQSGSAAVRGTVWLTQDRCDGTLVRVLRGRVLVHAFGAPRAVLIGAGRQYLARAR